MKKNYFSYQTAIIDEGAKVGEDTRIWHNVHVANTAKIGKNCNIGQNCYIAGIVGDNCRIQNNVNIYIGVKMGDWVFCGPSMTFTNDHNPRSKYPKNGNFSKTTVKEGASFGAHTTVVCGVTIGKWVLAGAGSVITKDIPDYALVYGNPARIKGWICECGEKLPVEFTKTACTKCKRKYQKKGMKVKLIK